MNLFQEHSADLAAAAERYWSQDETHRPLYEFLLKPPVTVLEKPEDAD